MRLYNTLTKQIEDFKPLEAKKVKLFVCGPTVYDLAHIGNAKTYTQFDVLARVLRDQGHEVFYLQNITDIDDKIIARAKEKGVTWDELGSQYEAEYFKDMKSLGNTAVTTYARATDYIDDIIRQVQILIDKGYGYKTDDGIYFEIATFPGYGKLSGRTEVRDNDAETRIDQSDQKRGWNDFCLWKFSKPGEPVWDAPFGEGRPGWHIEDTAISEHFFGPQYDIHGGAVDLIFPHHEAEITQMESASGKVPFVRYWAHVGFLNIDNKRMGKSLGNFYTIRDVLGKGYDPMAIRLFMLQTHYRSPINFSFENLDAAQNRLKAYQAMADMRWQTNEKGADQSIRVKNTREEVRAALADDLNTAQALAALSTLETAIDNGGIGATSQEAYESFLKWLDDVLDLGLFERGDISEAQKQLIADRQEARRAEKWAESDELRGQLKEQNITIRDTDHGPVWSRL